jgi:nitrous oxidase accessory protein NosD
MRALFSGPGSSVDNTMIITRDKHFEKNNLPGSGTFNDPYIIENRIFGTESEWLKSTYTGLRISQTTKYFVIRNCTFYGGLKGLLLSQIADDSCQIQDCSFYTITQTTLDNPTPMGGIKIENSNGIILRNNSHYGNSEYMGIQEFVYEDFGMAIVNSERCLIEKSTFYCDVLIYSSTDTKLRNNLQEDSTVTIHTSHHSQLNNNSLEDHRIPMKIISSNNITIYKNIINASLYGNGIFLDKSTWIYILNNSFYVQEFALYASNCSNINIINNTIYRETNASSPYELIDCFNIFIQDNIIHEPILLSLNAKTLKHQEERTILINYT